MEIKIVCSCGTKFKFDVEPVGGAMPTRINCPACGQDATAQANEIIRQAVPSAPPTGPRFATLLTSVDAPSPAVSSPTAPRPAAAAPLRISRPTNAPAPAIAPPAAPPPPPAPPPATPVVRINRPASAAPAAATPPPPPPPPSGGGLRLSTGSSHAGGTGGTATASGGGFKLPPNFKPLGSHDDQPAAIRAVGKVFKPTRGVGGGRSKTLVTTAVTLVVVFYGLWQFGSKWYHRFKEGAGIASIFSDEGAAENLESNLWYEDCVVIFIAHTNQAEVVNACTEFWKTKLNKQIALVPGDDDFFKPGEYPIYPAHNGYMRVIGTLEWPQPQYEGLCQFLSERLKTRVIETRDVDFSGAYHFGVYEEGQRKFHAQMEIKIANDAYDEVVTVENEAWAVAHGFDPAREEEGFKSFHLGHADDITKRLGLKMWDEQPPEGEYVQMVLREAGVR